MTEELPAFLDSIVFEIVDERTRLSQAGSAELRDIVDAAVGTRPGTTPEAVLQVLHRFKLEGLVETSDRSHYRVALCVAEPSDSDGD